MVDVPDSVSEITPWAALDAGDSWDFHRSRSPVCPHCARECRIDHEEWWHLYEEGEQEVACPQCDGKFTVSTAVEYRFSTDEQERSDGIR